MNRPNDRLHAAYLEKLVTFSDWLLAQKYDIRILIGDAMHDAPVAQQFKDLLQKRRSTDNRCQIIYEPLVSVEQLLSQLAATDVVVATRFHNVLLALVLNKPAIAISVHYKTASLMNDMGLSEYWQDIRWLDVDKLITQFCALRANAARLRRSIAQKTNDYRKALDEQYSVIFADLFSA